MKLKKGEKVNLNLNLNLTHLGKCAVVERDLRAPVKGP